MQYTSNEFPCPPAAAARPRRTGSRPSGTAARARDWEYGDGEQTGASILDDNEGREKEKAQDAVTWVIINRVLGQNSVHTQGREVTLRSVVTTEK